MTQSHAAQDWPRLKPIAPERYGLQVTLDQETHDLLREAQDLLGHTEGGGQILNVLTRSLRLFVRTLKQHKFAETERPRRASRKPKKARTIPAEVKRAVRARDEGCCTFVSEKGERCPARSQLEYDHKQPVAQGGKSTAENVRLRCRAHNQLAAEQAFGEDFMQDKRARAQRASETRKAARTKVSAPRETPALESVHEKAYELIPWLRERSTTSPGAP
jgi:5-methylcytosine-specific restriction endonuclease McrA